MGLGQPTNLGTIFGVHARIDLSVFIVAAIFVFDGLRGDTSLQNVLNEVTFVVLLFLSILLHELGHAAGAYLFGIRTLDVTLTFFGGYARLSSPPRTTIAEIVISFAGPGANLAIAWLLSLWLFSAQGVSIADHSWSILSRVQYMNWALGIFNLLPGFPLDGGNITRAILAKFMPNNIARLIVGFLGVGIGFILIALGLSGGFGLFFGILFIYWASIEIQAARSSRF
jgi:Zn-dependent protease